MIIFVMKEVDRSTDNNSNVVVVEYDEMCFKSSYNNLNV